MGFSILFEVLENTVYTLFCVSENTGLERKWQYFIIGICSPVHILTYTAKYSRDLFKL